MEKTTDAEGMDCEQIYTMLQQTFAGNFGKRFQCWILCFHDLTCPYIVLLPVDKKVSISSDHKFESKNFIIQSQKLHDLTSKLGDNHLKDGGVAHIFSYSKLVSYKLEYIGCLNDQPIVLGESELQLGLEKRCLNDARITIKI